MNNSEKQDGHVLEWLQWLKSQLEHERAWHDATLNADHWFALTNVEAEDAAMLMCQFNPSLETLADIKADGVSVDGIDGAYVERLSGRLADLAGSVPLRSMRDWIALASAHHLLGVVVSGRFVERPAHAWASKYAETLFDQDSRDGQLRRDVAARGRVRTSQLDAVIQAAKKKALDPSDWHSVWAQLGEMAQSTDRPLPLLGYVEGEGLKYTKDDAEGSTAFLSKDAFRMRMRYVSTARKRTRTKASEG